MCVKVPPNLNSKPMHRRVIHLCEGCLACDLIKLIKVSLFLDFM